MKTRILLTLTMLFSMFATACQAQWVNFRVNNTVMVVESNQQVAKGKTLFVDGKVYDYLTNLKEIIVFNPEKSTFYILNTRSREKVIVTMDQIDNYFESLRQWAATHQNEETRFFAMPQFKIVYNEEDSLYTFQSKLVSYEVATLKPEKTEMLSQYRQFADAYCKLNLMLSPQTKTLFARMNVNETIFNAGSLMSHVQVTFPPQKSGLFTKKLTIRSDYQFLPRLVESDLARIRQVDEFIAMYEETTFSDYQKNLKMEKDDGKN